MKANFKWIFIMGVVLTVLFANRMMQERNSGNIATYLPENLTILERSDMRENGYIADAQAFFDRSQEAVLQYTTREMRLPEGFYEADIYYEAWEEGNSAYIFSANQGFKELISDKVSLDPNAQHLTVKFRLKHSISDVQCRVSIKSPGGGY